MPINKRLWTPTFVLTTCGLAALLLGLLVYVIDIRRLRGRWCSFFEVFGANPLALYVFSQMLSIFGGWLFHDLLMDKCLVPCCFGNPYLSSLLHALVYVVITWIVGFVLYCRRIYIKI